MNPLCSRPVSNAFTRRQFFHGLGATLGSLAFTNLLAKEGLAAPAAPLTNPLAPRQPTFPARAKNVIMLFMEGGPGHMDTFDPKPKLSALHKTESKRKEGQETGFKFFVGSPFGFQKVGRHGIEICDQ